MFMLKSNDGSGTVSNCQFNNFIGHTNAYSLDLNAYWSSEVVATGNSVLYENLVFNNWKGTCSNGVTRGPIQVICPALVPCTGITIENFAMWTEADTYEYYKCENAYGGRGCLNTGSDHTSYTTTQTVTAAP